MAQLESTGARLEVSSPVLSGGPEDEVLWTDVMATAPDRAPPVDPATFRVNGTYAPAVGDFDGDGFADVYWYGAWGRSDGGWAGTEQPGVFDETAMASSEQAGTFLPVAGDFDGDGDDDIYWYQPGRRPAGGRDLLQPRAAGPAGLAVVSRRRRHLQPGEPQPDRHLHPGGR